jgi:hypothetical protein
MSGTSSSEEDMASEWSEGYVKPELEKTNNGKSEILMYQRLPTKSREPESVLLSVNAQKGRKDEASARVRKCAVKMRERAEWNCEGRRVKDEGVVEC